MTEKLSALNTLLDIFNAARSRLLPAAEILELMRRKGVYANLSPDAAKETLANHLTLDRSPTFPFVEFEIGHHTFWGLETWFPLPSSTNAPVEVVRSRNPLPETWQVKHSIKKREIESGAITLPRAKFDALAESIEQIAEGLRVVVCECYGYEKFACALNRKERTLIGPGLAEWFAENRVHLNDEIELQVETDSTCVVTIFAPWDRNADIFRNKLERDGTLPSQLPIRDLIWLFLKQAGRVVSRAEITQSVLSHYPEVSEQRIGACLATNPYLFTNTGKQGNWVLEAWNLDRIVLRESGNDSLPSDTRFLRLDDILTAITQQDLVFKTLQASHHLMTVPELAEQIALRLGIDPSVLTYASFIAPSDIRLMRVSDAYGLFADSERIIGELVRVAVDLTTTLEQRNRQIQELQSTLAAQPASQIAPENESLRVELADTNHKLKDAFEALVQREQELEQARQQAQTATARLTQTQITLDILRAEHATQVSELYRQHLQSEKHVAETAAALAAAQQEIETLRGEHIERVNELETQLASTYTQLAHAQNDAEAATQTCAAQAEELERQITEAHTQLAETRSQLAQACTETDALRVRSDQQLAELQQRVSQSRQQYEETLAHLTHTKRDLADSQSREQKSKAQWEQTQQAIFALQAEFATQTEQLKTQNVRLEQKLADATAQLARIQEENANTQADLSTQASKLTQRNAELEQRLTDMTGELNQTRQQAERNTSEFAVWLDEREKNLANAKKKLAETSSLLMKSDQELALTRQQARDYGARFAQASLELESLRTERAKMIQELNELRRTRQDLINTLAQLARSKEMLDKTHELARRGFEQRTRYEAQVNKYFERPLPEIMLDILQGRKPQPPDDLSH